MSPEVINNVVRQLTERIAELELDKAIAIAQAGELQVEMARIQEEFLAENTENVVRLANRGKEAEDEPSA